MNNFEIIDLEGERVKVEWGQRGFFIEGYEHESEKTALLLTGGYGSGVGVLLVALKECANLEDPNWELQTFARDLEILKDINPNKKGFQDISLLSNLTYTYLSFSPDVYVRRYAVRKAKFSPVGWARMKKEKNGFVVLQLLLREDLPQYFIPFWLGHPDYFVRRNLASRTNLQKEYLRILAKDHNTYVVSTLASNPSAPTEILQNLSKSQDIDILRGLIENPKCPLPILLFLARTGSEELSFYLATRKDKPFEFERILAQRTISEFRIDLAGHTTNAETLKILAKDTLDDVRELVAINPFTPMSTLSALSQDDSEIVVRALKKRKRALNVWKEKKAARKEVATPLSSDIIEV